MKKTIFTLAIIFTISLLSVSCTTDAYDADMEQNNMTIHSDDTEGNDSEVTNNETDPIVIPKRD